MPTLTGTSGNDFIFGTSGDDLIEGLGGNDLLIGQGGNDELRGGDGNDDLDGSDGQDVLYGGNGNDKLDGRNGQDSLYGDAGDDEFRVLFFESEGGRDVLDGGDGIDLVIFSYYGGGLRAMNLSFADPSTPQVIDGLTVVNIERGWISGTAFNDTIVGGAYADTLGGGMGNDVLDGGGGDDVLDGGEGSDTVLGGAGNDLVRFRGNSLLDGGTGDDRLKIDVVSATTLDISDPSVDQFYSGSTIRNFEGLDFFGSYDSDRITGGSLGDLIIGNPGDDVLRGGGGNDTLSGDGGVDELYGEAGDDRVHGGFDTATTRDAMLDGGDGFDFLGLSTNQYGGSTTIDLAVNSDWIRNFEQINFTGGNGVNNVTGGSAADSLRGGTSGDEFRGLGGDDSIYGEGGGDLLFGGEGNDWIQGDAGADTIYGEGGNDTVFDNSSEGNFIDGGSGDDVLTGGSGSDTLIGGEGDDRLDGSAGADLMTGGLGNDIYYIETAGDVATELAGEGVDEIRTLLISFTLGDNFENLSALLFNEGVDSPQILIGNGLDNVITGNFGDNRLDGGAGADVLRGSLGNDSYFVDNAADQVVEAPDIGAQYGYEDYDTVYAGVSYVLAAGSAVEVLATIDNTATTAINLTGNALANYVTGNAGANILDGGAGPDQLWGRGGDDSYYADAGDDVVEYDGDGYDILYARSSYALGIGQSIEVLATIDNNATTAINLKGNAFSNYIVGNAGANTLDGGGGDDQLWGREGDDSYIADMNDIVLEYAGQGSDILYASEDYILAAGLSVEILATVDNMATTGIDLYGNELDNYVTGNAGANTLDGGTGSDTLWGRAGDDSYFADGNDVVREDAGEGSDIVYARGSFVLGAGVSVEILATADNNATNALNLSGNELDNYVTGNAGANILDGGAGADQLFGRGGADSFAFTSALGGGNVDTILDFVAGTDRIALDDAIFSGIGAPGNFNTNAFFAGTAAHDLDDRIIYDQATGQLYYDADGNGAGGQILFATLSGSPALGAGDFTVI